MDSYKGSEPPLTKNKNSNSCAADKATGATQWKIISLVK